MENDIYRQVLQELSRKSEKDFGFQRVEDEKAKITQYIITGISLLLQLLAIVLISTYFAVKFGDVACLNLNAYFVVAGTAILGSLNYPLLWKKFTRKRIIISMMIVLVLFALSIFSPATVLSQIKSQLPFSFFWGAIVSLISFINYYMSYAAISLVELVLDLASVFLPVLPTTFGKSLPDLTSLTYSILYRETAGKETGKRDLKYLISASQADIDSAGIRSLPWVVLLGLGATSFSDIFSEKLISVSINIFLGIILLTIGLLAIFSMARLTYFQALIIQVANRLLIDLPETDSENQKKPRSLMSSAESNQPGCFLKILLPWKRWK